MPGYANHEFEIVRIEYLIMSQKWELSQQNTLIPIILHF